MTYTTRLIWERSAGMERDLAQSKARALLEQVEWMEFSKQSRLEIWRAAVHARAYATLAQDQVLASNAAAIIERVRPPKSVAERRAIHDKAVAVLARLTPSSSPWMSAAEQRRIRAWVREQVRQARER